MANGSLRTVGASSGSANGNAETKRRSTKATAASVRPVGRAARPRSGPLLAWSEDAPIIPLLYAVPHRAYIDDAVLHDAPVSESQVIPISAAADDAVPPADPLFSCVLEHELELDPHEPAALELTNPALWRAAVRGEFTPLVDLVAGSAGSIDRTLVLWPIDDGERRVGGLVLRIGAKLRSGAGAVRRKLRDEEYETLLIQQLALLSAARERDSLVAFRSAVGEALPYGFIGLDHLGRVLYLGGRAEEILGVPLAEARGRDCARIFRAVGLEDRNPLLDGLRGRAVPIELYIARPDGRELPISLLVSRVGIRGSRRKGLVAFIRDLTEERALAEAESQRDRLAALGELSAGVAHEIRNPLTGIANCAQVLKEGRLAPEAQGKFLDIILEEAARLNRIVEGLLRYARPHRPELRETDVNDCVRRALDLESSTLADRGVRTRLTVRGRIPLIYLDPGQIEQVLLNLVRNAGEAMPEGGELKVEVSVIRRLLHRRRGTGRRATDRVRFAREGPRARFVQVRVSDTGRGIPKELLSRIWNPFFTTRTRGTGLGLSLSLSIVREHGGTLTARSVEGKGTTILMDLPIERRQGERRTAG